MHSDSNRQSNRNGKTQLRLSENYGTIDVEINAVAHLGHTIRCIGPSQPTHSLNMLIG